MSTINMKQLLHNIKEAYVTASGDTEAITYGNIADKIKNMESGSSTDGTVTRPFVEKIELDIQVSEVKVE